MTRRERTRFHLSPEVDNDLLLVVGEVEKCFGEYREDAVAAAARLARIAFQTFFFFLPPKIIAIRGRFFNLVCLKISRYLATLDFCKMVVSK